MSFPFDAHQGLIVVRTELTGPVGSAVLRLALDTAATRTIIHASLLVAVGYDPALSPDRVEVTTGSGVEFAPRVTVMKIAALGQTRLTFDVLAREQRESQYSAANNAGSALTGVDLLKGTHFAGLIDEIKIDNRALTPSEVKRAFKAAQ